MARVTITKPSCYRGWAWATMESSFLQNRGASALSWTDAGMRLLLRLLSTKVALKGILQPTTVQAMGIISWNKIARLLCLCTSPGDAHERLMGRCWILSRPAETWGTGAAQSPPWSWIQGECTLGKGTILHIFHLTNHRQFVFKHFGYCIAV